MSQTLEAQQRVPDAMAGLRLDQAAAELFADHSRERLKAWIKSGELTVDGNPARPKDKVYGGEQLQLTAEVEDDTRFEPQEIPLDVVHEDDEVLVIDKPAGLVVHPAAGTPTAPCSMRCCTTALRLPVCRGRASCTASTRTPLA